MRILITGSTGFLGSHCARVLAREGHTLRLLVRSAERARRVLEPLGVPVDDAIEGDMSDATAVSLALQGCDAVLHTAATMYGGEETFRANVAGARHMLGSAADGGLDPIVHISSVGALFPPPGPIARSDDPVGDLETVYGRSKAEAERIARALQADGAPVTCFYPGGIYGPEDPVLGESMKGLRDAIRFGWPTPHRGGVSIVDVRDLAELVAIAMQPGHGPRRFMAGGHFHSWAAFADLCEGLTGRRQRRIPAPPFLLRTLGRSLDLLKRIVPFEYPLTHEAALFLTQLTPCDSQYTIETLGRAFRSSEETIGDSIRWLVEEGQLTPAQAGRLADPGA